MLFLYKKVAQKWKIQTTALILWLYGNILQTELCRKIESKKKKNKIVKNQELLEYI